MTLTDVRHSSRVWTAVGDGSSTVANAVCGETAARVTSTDVEVDPEDVQEERKCQNSCGGGVGIRSEAKVDVDGIAVTESNHIV